jgi:Ca-activated chloride channel homolog
MSRVIRIREIMSVMKIFLLFSFVILPTTLKGQADKKFIRKGNREYEKTKFSDSEISYRKAIDKNKQSPDAVFNIGDALYKQNKFEDAGKQFIESTNENYDRIKKSEGLYNLGNSMFKTNKLQESIDAYKNSLKLNPRNMEAKYNLSYVQDLLTKQQKQQQQQDKDKKDQDKNKNKNDKNKDQKDQSDKNKDQQKDQNKNQDQKQPPKQQQEISKEDAQRLLNSMANDEKKVEEKIKLDKAAKEKVTTKINW